eukprot:CAMPEP_0197823672 /NCGR_PEP_ID=MMETSP1437-20131217/999_1 /TAXON_ID=49252 ORGANISM="Eucampia antarctica, Strain CCMP1452" /NCGR_SAMPLE_ID=MMETSP1437 /ASSEMBLY_ACC=CAM_ASM_001096 /LENGTH=220 /DNA_ID=CAMNT_0043422957 /DNA_START=49 /DNA_END=711 /DNA_ORIENTATION=-
MKTIFSVAVIALACIADPTSAFAPVSSSNSRMQSVQLSASKGDNKIDVGKIMGSSAVAAALIISNVLGGADVASAAMDNNNYNDFSGSSSLVAARSGGRAGGRSSYRAPSRSYGGGGSTTIRRTTVVQPMYASPPVVVSPFGGYGYGGYGYNPLGGVGLGLNAVGAVGNEMRDYRQEGEIQKGRAELEVAKQREAELAARITQLEMNQRTQQPVQPLKLQ